MGLRCDMMGLLLNQQNFVTETDFFAFIANQKYHFNYEFFFSEVSYGPFSTTSGHTSDDFVRLYKFANDSFNHILHFISKFENKEELICLFKELQIVLFHFHGMY